MLYSRDYLILTYKKQEGLMKLLITIFLSFFTIGTYANANQTSDAVEINEWILRNFEKLWMGYIAAAS